MKKLSEFLLNEVEAFKQPRDKLAKSELGLKKTSNSKTDGNFDVKTVKDNSKRASYKKGEDISAYENSNLNVREETTKAIVDLVMEISKDRLKNYLKKSSQDSAVQVDRMYRPDVRDDADKKYENRKKGFKTASKKYTKEEVNEGLSALGAKYILHKHKAEREFFDLDVNTISDLHVEATILGYRGTDNGNSLSHNFHSHLVRKAKGMNEETELAEISRERVTNYLTKAKSSWDAARKDFNNPMKQKAANNTLGKRNQGIDDARKRLKEDELTEISAQKKADYVSAAKDDLKVKKAGFMKTRNGDPEYAKSIMKKALKRKAIVDKTK